MMVETRLKSNKVVVAESNVEGRCVPYKLLGYTGLSKHPHLYITTLTKPLHIHAPTLIAMQIQVPLEMEP